MSAKRHFVEEAERLLATMPVLDMVMPDDSEGQGKIEETARVILDHFMPGFCSDGLKVKQFTDGITNKLFKFGSESSKGTVLLRIYGQNTELMIDREQELLVLISLSPHGLVQPVYGRFTNGIVYGFQPGTVFTPADIRDRKLGCLVAKRLAAFHVLGREYVALKKETQDMRLMTTLRTWLQVVAEIPEIAGIEATKEEVVQGAFELARYRREVDALDKTLALLPRRVVFCHNDLLAPNIILAPDGEVQFIDFEYGSFNDRAFDIANHFCEMMGFEVDRSLYPSAEHQRLWVHAYVTESRKQEEQLGRASVLSLEEEVDMLAETVTHFEAAAHLYWGIWAVVQNHHSLINDFDFLDYSRKRLSFFQELRAAKAVHTDETRPVTPARPAT